MKSSGLLSPSAALCVTLWLAPSTAQESLKVPCAEKDVPCLEKALKQHPATRMETWKTALAKPSAERIGAAPAALVEYLTLDNILNGYPDRPRPAQLNAALRADVDAAIADLPRQVLGLFRRKLAGVYFVEGLGGTGYTDYVFDAGGKAAAAFIVLDAAVLASQTANGWATWKENTPFKPDGTYSLSARIEAEANNNRKNAMEHQPQGSKRGRAVSLFRSFMAYRSRTKSVSQPFRHPVSAARTHGLLFRTKACRSRDAGDLRESAQHQFSQPVCSHLAWG